MLETIIHTLKQLIRYPKEYRIAAPDWPDLAEAMDDLAGLLESAPSGAKAGSEKEAGLLNLAVEMGTAVWRLQRRLTAEGELPEELRRLSRDLKSAWDALRQEGIEVKDHTGEKFDSHMALRVIQFQPTPGLTCEQVIETIKPTIYRKDRMVQIGEVIVGVPEAAAKPETPEQK